MGVVGVEVVVYIGFGVELFDEVEEFMCVDGVVFVDVVLVCVDVYGFVCVWVDVVVLVVFIGEVVVGLVY